MPASRRVTLAIALSIAAAVARPVAAQPDPCERWQTENGIPGSDRAVRAFAPWRDGAVRKLVLGGEFTRIGDLAADRVALYDGRTCVPLQSPGNRLNGTVDALAEFDDGTGPSIFAAGEFRRADGSPADFIARWDGALWVDVGGGLDGPVDDLLVFDDGRGPALFAAGSFTSAGGVSANRIARWDGRSWTPLANGLRQGPPGSPTRARSLAAFDDGSGVALYAGGSFVRAGSVTANCIARWDGAAWTAVGEGFAIGGEAVVDVRALVPFDDGLGAGPRLIAGGHFTSAGGAAASHVAAWDGVAWAPLGRATMSGVNALATFDFGTGPHLYAGGERAWVDGVPTPAVASWNGAAWSDVGLTLTTPEVLALRVHDLGRGSRLFVGGNFGDSEVALQSVAAFTGTLWESIVPALSRPATVLAGYDDGTGLGATLVAGGLFGGVSDRRSSYIARRRDGEWRAFGDGVDGPVNALAQIDDGSGPALYVGGSFLTAGGLPAPRVARWRDERWETLGPGFPFPVQSLVGFDDGTGLAVYASGQFAGGFARFDGAAWATPPGGAIYELHTLVEHDDGTGPSLFGGGAFARVGGVVLNRVARWDGTRWSPLGSGLTGIASSLAVHDDGTGPALYAAGGSALLPDGSRVAKWDGVAWTPVGELRSGHVRALRSVITGAGSVLVAGGDTLPIGAGGSRDVAAWDGASWNPLGEYGARRVWAMTVLASGSNPGVLFLSGESDADWYLARLENACSSCRAGTVNVGAGRVADVLFVNDSAGGSDRRVESFDYEPFTLFIATPPAALGAKPYALYAWRSAPGPLDFRSLPFGLGTSCLPMPLTGGSPQPTVVWNNTGSRALGIPTHPSSPAPSIVVNRRNGLRRKGTFFLQGVIGDPGSAGERLASVTNGVTFVSR